MVKTFSKGGVHSPDNKLSAAKPIERLPLPETLTVPISQHIGVPATCVVNVNDKIKTGQVIAKAEGFVSANIHAPASGTILKIEDVMDSCGYKRKAIVIKVEGDEWVEGVDLTEVVVREIPENTGRIAEKVKEAGIVGLGGATFPSHVKLSVPRRMKAEYLIVNGVECEPYLTADHRLMLEKGEEILIGIKLIMKALGVKKAFVGIENNKPDAIKNLKEYAKHYEGVEIYPLKVQYPQGAEKQLVEALTGKQIPPPPGLPMDVGCVVQNVGTLFAVYEAVQKNKPLVERVVTITGKTLSIPSNFLTRIGTPIINLIEAAGGLPDDTGKVISGGPMMGRALNTLDMPVTKGTSGVLLMANAESKRNEDLNCIRCAKCVSVCPLGLEPYLLMMLSEKSHWEDLESHKIMNCCECGSCSFTCPSKRPLLDYIRLGKSNLGKILKARKEAEKETK